jgi:uncharacterized repeat protein (TIGR01451 family)
MSACHRLVLVVALVASSSAFGQANFANFCDTSQFTLNGSAASLNPNGDCVLRLTNNLGQSGSAFLTNTISLASDASFSTFFSFQISNPLGASDGDGQGADGLVFVVQTVANNVGGGGGGIGYAGIANSVGIEFDTWDNGGADPDGNHVGINLNGSVSSVQAQSVTPRLNNGQVWFAWVDYNGVTDTLEVRVSETSTRPALPLMTEVVDLVAVLGQTDAFTGFTSGTGAAGNTHDILTWQFVGSFAPIGGAALDVVKTADPDPVALGANIVFTIVLTNTGDEPATNVTLKDPLASSLSFVSASTTQGSCTGGATVNCTIGTLAPSASATVTITALVVAPESSTNVATAQGDGITASGSTTYEIAPVPIPMASEWALMMLAVLLAAAGFAATRS